MELPENGNRVGLGFSCHGGKQVSVVRPFKDIFRSEGFINSTPNEADAILEDKPECEGPSFVTPGVVVKNWTSVDIPNCIHISK